MALGKISKDVDVEAFEAVAIKAFDHLDFSPHPDQTAPYKKAG